MILSTLNSDEPAKDISAELDYQARHAAAASPIEKNSIEKIARYRDCKNHRSVRKEYTFRLIHQLKPATVLDFGCGDGEVCVQLTLLGYKTTGFDVSPEYIQLAQERARVDGVEGKAKFFVADASNVTIEAQTFDLVLVQLVLHHVDLRPCLENIRKHVKPGGRVIIVEPVAYSATLRWLRDRTPVEKDISPNERQLTHADLKIIGEYFTVRSRKHFRLLGRLDRVLPRFLTPLLFQLDALLLAIPGMSHFAAAIVILAECPNTTDRRNSPRAVNY